MRAPENYYRTLPSEYSSSSELERIAVYLWSLRFVRTLQAFFTLWTWRSKVSKALQREFDCVIFSRTLKITPAEILSFRLKLIPITFSCTLTSSRIETPTITEFSQFSIAYSNRSGTLSRKWEMAFLSSHGCRRRTVSYVPTVLNCLYCLVISSTTKKHWYVVILKNSCTELSITFLEIIIIVEMVTLLTNQTEFLHYSW